MLHDETHYSNILVYYNLEPNLDVVHIYALTSAYEEREIDDFYEDLTSESLEINFFFMLDFNDNIENQINDAMKATQKHCLEY